MRRLTIIVNCPESRSIQDNSESGSAKFSVRLKSYVRSLAWRTKILFPFQPLCNSRNRFYSKPAEQIEGGISTNSLLYIRIHIYEIYILRNSGFRVRYLRFSTSIIQRQENIEKAVNSQLSAHLLLNVQDRWVQHF